MSVEIVADGFSAAKNVDPEISEALLKTKEMGGEAAAQKVFTDAVQADKYENSVRSAAQALGIGANVRKVALTDGRIAVKFRGKDKRAKSPNGARKASK